MELALWILRERVLWILEGMIIRNIGENGHYEYWREWVLGILEGMGFMNIDLNLVLFKLAWTVIVTIVGIVWGILVKTSVMNIGVNWNNVYSRERVLWILEGMGVKNIRWNRFYDYWRELDLWILKGMCIIYTGQSRFINIGRNGY